jgi:GTP pyrophosphokinase
MVTFTQTFPIFGCAETPDVHAWLSVADAVYSAEDAKLIRSACDFVAPLYASHRTSTGAWVMQHALGTASILAEMRLDAQAVAAAVLHDVPECVENSAEKLVEKFGHGVAQLVDGVARMGQIQHFGELHNAPDKEKGLAQAEGLRQMLLAMVEDIRVVLIKLAERTQTMRCLSQAEEALRQKVAEETREIFAPLANRLGVWQLKWELEDLSCRYLDPVLYKKIAKSLDEKRLERERYIGEVIGQLRDELAKAQVAGEVTGRPKHIFSIINKMRRKRIDFEQVYDVRAVRVLVPEVKDCYTVLGLVHHLWQPISGEFDDYISHPKSNDYRSLHTAVIGPEGQALEVQIRTFDMHQYAEYGVAAHWRYKEGGKVSSAQDEKIAWLRQILEWKEDLADSSELLDQFKSELKEDRVFVFTPQGKVVDLPAGATPIDFAYHVHSTLGDRCRGAKVDGSIVQLSYKLANGQRVEIISAKQGGPSRDWLNPALGYVQSARSKAKIRHWFKYQNFDENVSQGRAQLDRELHRLGLTSFNQEKLAQKFEHNKLEDFLAALGRGDITNHQAVTAIQEDTAPKAELENTLKTRQPRSGGQKGTVLLEGVGNLLTAIAKCCNPMPPDSIVGYVTRGRGVTVHRHDCPSMLRLKNTRPDQVVDATWGGAKKALFEANLEIEANDRHALLRDISEVFTREKVSVTRVNSQSKDGMARMGFTVEVSGLEQLSRVLAQVNNVDGVVEARRVV